MGAVIPITSPTPSDVNAAWEAYVALPPTGGP